MAAPLTGDFLLELFSEEIPARMQADAIAHLQKALAEKLAKEGITASNITAYSTPRRLALWVKNLPTEQSASEEELKGPKTNAPEAALAGFLKKTGLTKDQLTEKDGIYFGMLRKEAQPTSTLLKSAIEEICSSFPWPKSMRWGQGSPTWVRPLHNILCLFDGK
ncbi:MAG: glycine--tRNA ligase subunit beta, partial [Rickettsiales bacterium]|nr:glycine--tRNA ligase subunit beta [Rickettsiales bacterium]